MADQNIILPEGQEDSHAIFQLLTRHGIGASDVTIERKIEGIENLLSGLSQRLRPGGIERYAIIVDADADVDEDLQFAAKWSAVRNRLTKCGYSVPDAPDPLGTIIDHDELPRVGVWLMPDNVQRGALEDFARLLIRDGDILYPYAQNCVDALPERRFGATYSAKAYIHTWLAWQENPGRPIGLAIRQGFFDPNAALAEIFVEWIRRLFEIPTSM